MEEVKVGLGIFLGPGKFLVASKWGSKGKTLPGDCEQLKRLTKLKLCRELHTINRTSEFYSGKLINWLSFYLNFSGKSLKFPTFCDPPTNDIFLI
jgi:hypothetical protein